LPQFNVKQGAAKTEFKQNLHSWERGHPARNERKARKLD
jgi:hypothetical protein